jgi:hypothetical protein
VLKEILVRQVLKAPKVHLVLLAPKVLRDQWALKDQSEHRVILVLKAFKELLVLKDQWALKA